MSTWREVARPEQLPPEGDWSAWWLVTGRGWGRTRTAAEFVCSQAEAIEGLEIAIVAPTLDEIVECMFGGERGLVALAPQGTYDERRRTLQWPNGSRAKAVLAESDRLRGTQYGAAWASWEGRDWEDDAWTSLRLAVRKKPGRIVVTAESLTEMSRSAACQVGSRIVIAEGINPTWEEEEAQDAARGLRSATDRAVHVLKMAGGRDAGEAIESLTRAANACAESLNRMAGNAGRRSA